MKAVFMGSDPIALPMLEYLRAERPADIELSAVYTQPDRRTGRGMHLQANAIKTWALEHGLEVRQPVKCGPDDAAFFRSASTEVVLVMAYGQLLPRTLLESVPLGFLNLHASILPRLRGASPIHTAVALGHPESGVSLMRIIPKMDAGPVADVERVEIGPRLTSAGLHARLAEATVPLVARNLNRVAAGQVEFTEQEDSEVTYCRIIEKTDAHLDFNQPARDLFNRVRAFQPWPGTSFPYDGLEIRVLEAEIDPGTTGLAAGTFHLDPDGHPSVACRTGALRLIRLQRPGGRPMESAAFLNGLSIPEGTVLESRGMRPLEAARPFPWKRK